MTPTLLGQLAALGTSIAWSFSSIFFTLSGRQVSSQVVNRIRLLLAVLFVSAIHWLIEGQFFPFEAEPFRFGWLGLSGIIGFVVGDGLLFQAFVTIGPRLSMLLMALAPVFGALLGWLFLGETLRGIEVLGILLAVGGVGLVVSDRQPPTLHPGEESLSVRSYTIGILLGIGAAVGQAGGLIASKLGLAGDFSPLSGNVIRLISAALTIWVLALVQRQAAASLERLRQKPRVLWAIIGGAIAGPTIGVWLSLFAVQNAPVGIASTLMSLSPVILLPVSYLVFKDRVGWQAISGTLFALAGTAILFLDEALLAAVKRLF